MENKGAVVATAVAVKVTKDWIPAGLPRQMENTSQNEPMNLKAFNALRARPDLIYRIANGYRNAEGLSAMLGKIAELIKKSKTLPGHEIFVRHTRKRPYGRLSAVGPSHAVIPRPVRHLLAFGLLFDVDIRCCHPDLAWQEMAKHGIEVPAIKAYAMNSKAYRAQIAADLNLDKEVVKALLQKVCNGGGMTLEDAAKTPVDHPLLRALKEDGKKILKFVTEQYPQLVQRAIDEDKPHPEISAVAYYLQGLENACLAAAWKSAKLLGLDPRVPIHDGFMCLKKPTEGQLRALEQRVKLNTGFIVTFEEKEIPETTIESLEADFAHVPLPADGDIGDAPALGKRRRNDTPEEPSEEEKLFLGGELGLARLYALKRKSHVVNVTREVDDFRVFDEESRIWERQGANFMITQEVPRLLEAGNELLSDIHDQETLCGNKEEKAKVGQREGAVKAVMKDLSSSQRRKHIAKELITLMYNPALVGKFDADPELLSLRENVVNLRTGEQHLRTYEDFMTYRLDLEYDPEHEGVPRIEEFVRQITLADRAAEVKAGGIWGEEWKQREDIFGGAEEMPNVFQHIVGYCLTGLNREQALFAFLGAGSNGKSSITNLLRWIMGELCTVADPSLLIHSKTGNTGGPAAHVMDLKGKRAALISEWDPKDALDERQYRTLTGDDTIAARGLYEKGRTEFKVTWKFILVMNELPTLRLQDSSLRRIHAIWFDAMFLPDDSSALRPYDATNPTHFKQVKDFEKGLSKEAFLAYAIEGSKKYLANGMPPKPKCMLRYMDKIKSDSDPLGAFFDDHVDTEDATLDDLVPCDDIYTSYTGYMANLRAKALGVKTFKKAMADKGFGTIRSKRAGTRDKMCYRRLRMVGHVPVQMYFNI